MMLPLMLVAVLASPNLAATIPSTSSHKPPQKRCRPRPQALLDTAKPSGLSGYFASMKAVDVINVGQGSEDWGGQGHKPGWGDGNDHEHGGDWGDHSWRGNQGGSTAQQDTSTAQQATSIAPPMTSTVAQVSTTTSTAIETQTHESPPPLPPPTPSQSSGAGTGGSGGDAEQMVQLHNTFRAQYDAPNVGWSDTLATYASNYASKCVFQHSAGPYGENLAAGTGGSYDVQSGFQAWADEASSYDPNNPQYSHFTQVVWKSTTTIGCAIIDCGAGTIFGDSSKYVICEYQPAGNVIGQFAENVA